MGGLKTEFWSGDPWTTRRGGLLISVHVKAFKSLTSTDEDFLAECTEKRDRMFNDIFLYSNFAFNIGCLIVGVLMDRLVHKNLMCLITLGLVSLNIIKVWIVCW